jgi:hypothetical protein
MLSEISEFNSEFSDSLLEHFLCSYCLFLVKFWYTFHWSTLTGFIKTLTEELINSSVFFHQTSQRIVGVTFFL